MSTLRNKVTLIGNAGMNPDVRTTENGRKFARLSLATHERYKNAQGERVENTQWHTITAWGKVAEVIEKFVSKGKEIAVDGKLVNKSWTTKEGDKRYTTEVEIDRIELLGSPNKKVTA